MTDTQDTATLLDRLPADGPAARSALIVRASDRLRALTRRMLRDFPHVGRWEQTDDVFQNALLRLCRALETVVPESPRHFYNLAALQVRRELLDLAARHLGPEGHGANHHTDGSGVLAGATGRAEEPSSVAEWVDFHRQVERLPDEEREVFDLLWYQGLSQEAAAEAMGVSVRTLKRRWQSARLSLAEACGGPPPG